MGYAPGSVIEKAGEHLLSILFDRTSVAYSTFYDGTDAAHDRLLASLGLDDDWYSPELLMDLAAGQLQDMGVVSIRQLRSKLADDEQDYLIELTEEGRGKLANGFKPTYRDMDL